jgi:hypothetical protein
MIHKTAWKREEACRKGAASMEIVVLFEVGLFSFVLDDYFIVAYYDG